MNRSSLMVVMAYAMGISGWAQGQTRSTAAAAPKAKSIVRVAAAQPRNRTIDFRLKPAGVLAQVEKTLVELDKIVQEAGAAGCEALTLP
jgi:hypothetical protein